MNGMKDPKDTRSPRQSMGGEQWQRVADSIADLLLLVDREGQILSANRPAFGHKLDGLVGRSVFEVCPEGLREDLRAWLEAVFSGESAPVLLMPREQGGESVRWFATYTGRNDGNALVSIDKRMVHSQPIEIGRREFHDILAAIGDLVKWTG